MRGTLPVRAYSASSDKQTAYEEIMTSVTVFERFTKEPH
jgi:hypothetical protein